MKVKDLMVLLAKCDQESDVGAGNLDLTGEFAAPVEMVYEFPQVGGGKVVYLDPDDKHSGNLEIVMSASANTPPGWKKFKTTHRIK